jgi:hypothetical protein
MATNSDTNEAGVWDDLAVSSSRDFIMPYSSDDVRSRNTYLHERRRDQRSNSEPPLENYITNEWFDPEYLEFPCSFTEQGAQQSLSFRKLCSSKLRKYVCKIRDLARTGFSSSESNVL